MTGNQLFDAPSRTGRAVRRTHRRGEQCGGGRDTFGMSLLAAVAERVDERSTGITPLAANPEVLGLQRGALFEELQRAWAI